MWEGWGSGRQTDQPFNRASRINVQGISGYGTPGKKKGYEKTDTKEQSLSDWAGNGGCKGRGKISCPPSLLSLF